MISSKSMRSQRTWLNPQQADMNGYHSENEEERASTVWARRENE